MVSTATKQVYLSIEQFDKDLEDCLMIITEPTQRNPYYVCEYISPALYKSIVHIYIKNNFKSNKMVSTATKQVYLSIEQFDKDLEDCLMIITEPTQRNPYYVCEYISPALYKSIVHIYIKK